MVITSIKLQKYFYLFSTQQICCALTIFVTVISVNFSFLINIIVLFITILTFFIIVVNQFTSVTTTHIPL